LLDRAAEVAAIAAAIESACAGSGSALLVEGVAGIGKTRLLTHACEQAAQAGMTVLAARAAEFEDGYAWEWSGSCSRPKYARAAGSGSPTMRWRWRLWP
jgi:hypothetical protein